MLNNMYKLRYLPLFYEDLSEKVEYIAFEKENVDTSNRLICYDILELGEQLRAIGMLVILDSILNRITQNRQKGKQTFVFIDEIYLLFMHEYSAQFLFKQEYNDMIKAVVQHDLLDKSVEEAENMMEMMLEMNDK